MEIKASIDNPPFSAFTVTIQVQSASEADALGALALTVADVPRVVHEAFNTRTTREDVLIILRRLASALSSIDRLY